MHFSKIFFSITIMILPFLLCSCGKNKNDLRIETSPQNTSLIDLASTIYDGPQLLELAKFNGSMDELNAQYPIECLREINSAYRASYLGNGSVAVILFDSFGNRTMGNIYSTQLVKSDFRKLESGQLLEDVQVLDPNGEYLFLHTGRDDTPKISSHYTKDGYLITIEYDTSNTIASINEELI